MQVLFFEIFVPRCSSLMSKKTYFIHYVKSILTKNTSVNWEKLGQYYFVSNIQYFIIERAIIYTIFEGMIFDPSILSM